MQKLTIAIVAFAALQMCQCLIVEPQAKYFNANPRALDYKFIGKNDEHRYGVELKENRQFHHTKSAEDGVRLGCYGHELEGKKYSTHYVADGKGYRLVPHQGLITVYPKDGGEPRQASFVQTFNEDEVRSENIRYFFPDGCSSASVIYDSLVEIPPILKKDEVIEVPVEETTTVLPEETTTEQPVTDAPIEAAKAPITIFAPTIYHILPAPILINLEIILPSSVFNLLPFQGLPYLPGVPACTNSFCINKSTSTIVIPIEKGMLEKIDVAEIEDLTNEKIDVKMVEKLLKLVEKSKI